MKIDEVPISVALEQIGTRAMSDKYLPVVEKIRELDEGKGNTALVIRSESREEHNRVQGFVYGFNKRSGYKYRINQSASELKIFVRLRVEDKHKPEKKKK